MDPERWDKRYAQRELVWSATPNRTLVQEVADLVPGTALDLGAGEGRNAIWLAERGWRVTAVDFSAVGIDKARRLAAARGVSVAWLVADLAEWQAPPQAYDLVIVFFLQLPADTRRPVLRAAAAALAPGGTFLYVGHDRSNLGAGYGGPQDPAVLATAPEVAADLDGLDIVKAGVLRRAVEVEPGHGGGARGEPGTDEHGAPSGNGAQERQRVALDVLVRARRPAQQSRA